MQWGEAASTEQEGAGWPQVRAWPLKTQLEADPLWLCVVEVLGSAMLPFFFLSVPS